MGKAVDLEVDWHESGSKVPPPVRAVAEVRLARLWAALKGVAVRGGPPTSAFRIAIDGWALLYKLDFSTGSIRVISADDTERAGPAGP